MLQLTYLDVFGVIFVNALLILPSLYIIYLVDLINRRAG